MANPAVFRFVSEITVRSFRDIDWNSYHVDREVATYAGQRPEHGVYTEFAADQHWVAGQQVGTVPLSSDLGTCTPSGKSMRKLEKKF